jgi:erythromycin esterase-like protein
MASHRHDESPLIAAIAHMATPLPAPHEATPESWNVILEHIGDAPIVLLGEATHGTQEFYAARAAITLRLVAERGFSALCIEGDLPHAARAHRWLRSATRTASATEALGGFRRFPQWMWRNLQFCELLGSLRELAQRGSPIGLYGLDLYSMHESIAETVAILAKIDPDEAKRARARYSCFEHFGDDPQSYGWATSTVGPSPCEDDVVAQLKAIQQARIRDLAVDDDALIAELAALSVKNGEGYYRSMFRGRVKSWNLRDTHMADALETVMRALSRRGVPPKIVVWAHNSHLGDAHGAAGRD